MTALSNCTSAVVSCESVSPSSLVTCPAPQPASSSENSQTFVVWVRMALLVRKQRAGCNCARIGDGAAALRDRVRNNADDRLRYDAWMKRLACLVAVVASAMACRACASGQSGSGSDGGGGGGGSGGGSGVGGGGESDLGTRDLASGVASTAFVYVSGYSTTIARYTLDAATGALTAAGTTTATGSPSFLAFDPAR